MTKKFEQLTVEDLERVFNDVMTTDFTSITNIQIHEVVRKRLFKYLLIGLRQCSTIVETQ